MSNCEDISRKGSSETLLARTEVRFRGTSPLLENQNPKLQESHWPDSWNTTMYMGNPDLDQPFPLKGTSRGRIRIRFRSEEEAIGNTIVYDLTQTSILEIKTHGNY